jgi:DNA repair protein RecO (recombination protein O)
MPSQPHSFRAEVVVLRHSDWGEADRLLTLYGRELGKVRAIAKGVRKIHSRKAGHLEPFTRVNLLLARGRDLLIVTQAETVEAYLPIKESLLLTGYAAYIIELLDRFTYEEGENRLLFDLLVEALARLARGDDPWLAVRYYEVRLLDNLGFRPELFHCVHCHEEIQAQDQYFSALAGGVLCPRCGAGIANTDKVSMQALKYLRHFQRSSYPDATRAHPTLEVQLELETLLQHNITFLLERKVNSTAFIREVRDNSSYQAGNS